MSGAAPVYAELCAASNFSFLHGASHGSDLVARALELGLAGLGIADRNTVAGVVRAWDALRRARAVAEEAKLPPLALRLVTGARLVFADGTPDILAYPATRAGWASLCRLLSTGNLRADKGDCVLRLDDLIGHLAGLLLIVLPESSRREDEGTARKLATILPDDPGRIGETCPPLQGNNVIPFPSRVREGTEGWGRQLGTQPAERASPPPIPPASGRGFCRTYSIPSTPPPPVAYGSASR